MKSIPFNTRLMSCVAAFLTLCSPSRAVDKTLDGVYAGAGTVTQVLVSAGRPASNSILNSHQEFMQMYRYVTDSVNPGFLKVVYGFEESNGQSIFTVSYYDARGGDLLCTFTSTIKVTVVLNTSTSYKTSSEWSVSVRLFGAYSMSLDLPAVKVEEEYKFDTSKFTCRYTYKSVSPYSSVPTSVSTLMTRTNTGTGIAATSPFVPNSPVWSRPTALNFPIIKPNIIIWCDPPYASSFQYSVASGREERIASLSLPKGFGTKIQVLAQPSAGGSARLLGTFNSGSKVDLLKQKGMEQGSKQVTVRGISPKADTALKTPYPVGFTFTNMKESAVKLSIQAKETTTTR
jgi:hypothetical protein